MMKKLIYILFLSCLKATELIEKKLYLKLSIKEKIQLKMHKIMCKACTRYDKQSSLLDDGISEMIKHNYTDVELDNLKLIIHEKLKKLK